MKYCSECRGEYEDWVEECADCGVRLVWDLPPAPVKKDDLKSRIDSAPDGLKENVPVYESSIAEDVRTIYDALKGEGIEPTIRSDKKHIHFGSAGSIEHRVVIVKAEDVVKAHEIIDSLLA